MEDRQQQGNGLSAINASCEVVSKAMVHLCKFGTGRLERYTRIGRAAQNSLGPSRCQGLLEFGDWEHVTATWPWAQNMYNSLPDCCTFVS